MLLAAHKLYDNLNMMHMQENADSRKAPQETPKKKFPQKKKYYIEEALQEISLSSLNK